MSSRAPEPVAFEAVADPESLRVEVRAFLERVARRRGAAPIRWGEGSDRVAFGFLAGPPGGHAPAAEAARAWQRSRFDAGLGWLTGPPELGGRGLGPWAEQVWVDESSGFDTPDDTLVRTGTKVLGPALLRFGTPEVHGRLRAVHRGDVLVCQLFSEPDAGSDLANVATRAVEADGAWRLTGQKVWSSGAAVADLGVCLARTSAQPKHYGISAFLVDMHAPGVVVRPIRQMTGDEEFSEVFLDDVAVPSSHLLGEVDGGWPVALDALMSERSVIGRELVPDDSLFERLVLLAQRSGHSCDPLVRQDLADLHTRLRGARLLVDRMLATGRPGAAPGPELAMAKLAVSAATVQMGELAARLLGPSLAADTGEWGTFTWNDVVLGAPGFRIGGGTDEILKSSLGERALGLPRDPR